MKTTCTLHKNSDFLVQIQDEYSGQLMDLGREKESQEMGKLGVDRCSPPSRRDEPRRLERRRLHAGDVAVAFCVAVSATVVDGDQKTDPAMILLLSHPVSSPGSRRWPPTVTRIGIAVKYRMPYGILYLGFALAHLINQSNYLIREKSLITF
jgi:hypothetical protein